MSRAEIHRRGRCRKFRRTVFVIFHYYSAQSQPNHRVHCNLPPPHDEKTQVAIVVNKVNQQTDEEKYTDKKIKNKNCFLPPAHTHTGTHYLLNGRKKKSNDGGSRHRHNHVHNHVGPALDFPSWRLHLRSYRRVLGPFQHGPGLAAASR